MEAVSSVPFPADEAEQFAAPRVLLSTKLYPPRLRPNFVARPRLIDYLNQNVDRRLTIVCGPAGYGKSTVTAQWLAHQAFPSAWVTLDAGDNNWLSFFRLVVAGLHTLDPNLATKTERQLSGQGAIREDIVIHQLIEELSATTRPFFLVLDDYHVIEATGIQHAVGLLIQHLPTTMRLVVISRSESPLPVARLRANGEMSQLGQEDLLFDRAESNAFFQDFLGFDMTPGEIELVHEHTEGWVAALNLAGVAMRGLPRDRVQRLAGDFAGSVTYIDQYLWEEALERQPDDLRSFLLRTSVLDRFTAELCDAVTDSHDSEKMIRQCERDNLFIIPLDESGRWFRYHHMMADALRDRLTQIAGSGELDELHRRASRWLEGQGLVHDAIRHAIAGHVWDRAISLLETTCAELFAREHVVELRTWLEGLPRDVLERSPRLAFWLAWALGRTGRWSDGAHPLRIAEEAWTATGDRRGLCSILLWHSVRSLHNHDNHRSLEYGQQALDLLADDRPIEFNMILTTMGVAHVNHGEPVKAERTFAELRVTADETNQNWLQSIEQVHSAGGLVQQGRLQEATALCRRVMRGTGDLPTEIWIQGALCHLGEVYLEWDLLEDAQHYLQRADDLADLTRSLSWRPRIRRGLAQIMMARGEAELALDEIEPAIAFAADLGTQQEIRNVRAQQARFWLASGNLVLARRWAESSGLDPYLPPEYERQTEHLTFARLLIHDSRPDLALPMLDGIRRLAETSGRLGELVEMTVLEALARKAAGDTTVAIESLQRALELGAPGGYIRTFVVEDEAIAPLLRHAAIRGSNREYAQRLLAVIDGSPAPARPDQSATTEALSERELEVLRLVAAGLANRDIGRRLFISDKTVKKHLSNILGKLEATNRTQAVDHARRMGLL